MSACVSEMFVSWKIFLVLAACHIIICFIIVLFQRTEEHEFERGMKLEAVNPHNPNQICAATITKIVGNRCTWSERGGNIGRMQIMKEKGVKE